MRQPTHGYTGRSHATISGLLLAVLYLGVVSHALADPTIVLTASPNPVEVGEELQVSLSANGSIDAIDEPFAEGLEFQSAGRQQSTSWTNGRVTSKIEVFFVAHPERPGVYKVGPVRAYLKGKLVAESKQILVKVKEGPDLEPASPGALQLSDYEGRAAFLVGRVPKPTVVIGEPFLFEMDLYVRRGLKVNGSEWTQPPSFKGFKREDLMQGRDATRYRKEIRIGRTRYDIYPVERSLLIPLTPGSRLLGEARQALYIPRSMLRRQKKLIRSRPVRLNVTETPRQGRPPSYRPGVVGSWEMSATLDRTTVKVGERVILDVQVSGEGNQDALPVPVVIVPDGVRVETIPGRDCPRRDVGTRGVKGSCRFLFILVSNRVGRMNIGPVEIPFFDNRSMRYKVASAGPWMLTVRNGKRGDHPGGRRTAKVLPREVQDPPFLDRLKRSSSAWDVPEPPTLLLGYGLPAVLFTMLLLLGRWRARRREDPRVAIRAVIARSRSTIRSAQKLGIEDGAVRVSGAMRDALVAMFAVDPRGMPRERIRLQLQKRGVTGSVTGEIVDLLEALEGLRYGGTEDLAGLQGDALQIIDQLMAGL